MKVVFFACVAFVFANYSHLSAESQITYEPLYAGTQLAVYPQNVAPGHFSIQPYIFAIRNFGQFSDDWSVKREKFIDQYTLLIALETGITDCVDITLVMSSAYSHCGHRHTWLYGDTKVYLAWQASREKKGTFIPDFRLIIGESFPTGKYENLNPNKLGSDVFGSGAFSTTFLAVLAKTFYCSVAHPFNLNLNVYYTIFANTHAENYSLYSGLYSIDGKAKPGAQIIVNLGLEISLNQRWAVGFDARYEHQNKSSIIGDQQTQYQNRFVSSGLPSSEQFSLAPCLEYSWSEDLSAAIGPWFTFAGRNSHGFYGFIANVFCYF